LGKIGLTSADEGLRIDSMDARVHFALGQKYRTHSKGNPAGLT
jgi:hypothetical protein